MRAWCAAEHEGVECDSAAEQVRVGHDHVDHV